MSEYSIKAWPFSLSVEGRRVRIRDASRVIMGFVELVP